MSDLPIPPNHMDGRIADEVISMAADAFGVLLENAFNARQRRAVYVRAAAMIALHKDMGWVQERAAGVFGKHHSTLIHHLNRHEHRLKYEYGYATGYNRLIAAMARRELIPSEKADAENAAPAPSNQNHEDNE